MMRTGNIQGVDGAAAKRFFAVGALAVVLGLTSGQQTLQAANEVTGDASTVRIASWDLHDLWQTPDQPLRAGSVSRTKSDFAALRAKAAALRADVIALQGLGSPRAARILFPSRTYFVIFSRELAVRQQRDRDMLTNPARRRVYNAIAIRRGAKLRVLAKEQILETADPSPRLGAGRPQGQSALAVKLKINKAPVWVLSARLVDGCGAIKEAVEFPIRTSATEKDSSRSAACTALHDQVHVLKAWASLKATKQETVIAGLALPGSKGSSDSVAWTALTHGDPVEVALAYRAKMRAVDRRDAAGRRRFVLTNPLVGSVVSVAKTKALQPNTVELTGPSRPARTRLVKRSQEPSKSGNLVIDALSDFAKSALRDNKATADASRQADTSLAAASIAGLNKLSGQFPATSVNKTRLTAKKVLVQYPDVRHTDDCRADQIGMNFIVVDKAFHGRTKGMQFGAVPGGITVSASGTGSRSDCAVYLDIPRHGS